jgi:hypothetical protein
MQVHMISMSAVGALLWSKRSKTAGMLVQLRVMLLAHGALMVAVR